MKIMIRKILKSIQYLRTATNHKEINQVTNQGGVINDLEIKKLKRINIIRFNNSS
jgi:hypothetical protein